MIQQTIDLHTNPSDETISEDLKQTMQGAGDTDQPDIFLLNEAAWNPPEEASGGCRNTGIHHVGLRATNPAASAEFYRDVLGMQIVGGSPPDHPIGATAFLSSRPDEESHEIALFANPAFAHVAFKVSSLAELRSLYARMVERNIPIKFLANHGVSFAFYFDDPDGNMIEVYWPTGDLSRSLQPQMEPLDLSPPDEVLLEELAAKHAHAGASAGRANGTQPCHNKTSSSMCLRERVRPTGAPEIRLRFSSPASKPAAPSSWRRYRFRRAEEHRRTFTIARRRRSTYSRGH